MTPQLGTALHGRDYTRVPEIHSARAAGAINAKKFITSPQVRKLPPGVKWLSYLIKNYS